jgi:hypothetical protein
MLLAAQGGNETETTEHRRPVLLVMNQVIDRLFPLLLAPPSDEARRLSVRGGLVGVGAYDPRGGTDTGLKTPPLLLFPRAGAGNSLNVDPATGRNSWNHMP